MVFKSAKKKKIYTFSGKPVNIISDLVKKLNIKEIYLNKDYEPYAQKRDDEIKNKCEKNGVIFRSFKDHVIFEKSQIVKKDGSPYKVYTPYSKVWMDNYDHQTNKIYPSENFLDKFAKNNFLPFLTYDEIGFLKSKFNLNDHKFSLKLVKEYEETRNYPYIDKTSRIGPYLRFGLISIRKLVKEANCEIIFQEGFVFQNRSWILGQLPNSDFH